MSLLKGYVNGTFMCDFESEDICQFHTSLPMDNGVWTWGTGYPYHDHTLDSDYGMYSHYVLSFYMLESV